ncbi:hypothetical protein RFI_13407, partial [Reticulomyxa filosa]
MAHSPQSSLGTDDDYEDVEAELRKKDNPEDGDTGNNADSQQSMEIANQSVSNLKENESGNPIENEVGERTERSRTMVFRESFDADSAPKTGSMKKRTSDSSLRKGRTESVFSGNDNVILSRIKTNYGLGGSMDATGTGLEEAIQQEIAGNAGGPPLSPNAPPPMTAEEELEFRHDLE